MNSHTIYSSLLLMSRYQQKLIHLHSEIFCTVFLFKQNCWEFIIMFLKLEKRIVTINDDNDHRNISVSISCFFIGTSRVLLVNLNALIFFSFNITLSACANLNPVFILRSKD